MSYDLSRALARDIDAREDYERRELPLRRPARVGHYIRCAVCREIKPATERAGGAERVLCLACDEEARRGQRP